MGSAWIAAWLFTIGVLHLGFWKGGLALVLWPYYLGLHCSFPGRTDSAGSELKNKDPRLVFQHA